MIGKISDPRGQRVAGLIYYLFGPGRREEHSDPHLVAGWREPAELEPPLRPEGGHRDFRRLIGLLEQPHVALGPRGFDRPVWHCAVRAAPEDRLLSDTEWAAIASDIMHRTGLAPHGQEDDAVRWIAVRHGPDHVHIVAMLARQDGARPRLSNERYRLREACRAAEDHFDLRRTAAADRTAARRTTRAENEKTARRGWSEPPRVTLKRAVSTAAGGAASQQQFFTRLADAGVLVRKRYSTREPDQLTGYSVALAHDTTATGSQVWYSGGKLAPDLTLPKLQQRWQTGGPVAAAGRLTAEERNAIWDHAGRTASRAAEQIRRLSLTDPLAAADAAWAAADVLHVASAALGSKTPGGKALGRAADAYDRAARCPYGRVPRPTPVGNTLRSTARFLSALGHVTSDKSLDPVRLAVQFAELIDSVACLRRTQQHAAQAAAARQAARHLHALRSQQRQASPHGQPSRRTTAQRAAALDFPASPGTWPPAPVQGSPNAPPTGTRPAARRPGQAARPRPGRSP